LLQLDSISRDEGQVIGEPGLEQHSIALDLKASMQRVPVIFFSAQATQEEEDRALRSGAVAFLRKPVRKDTLLRVIHMAFESTN
jgi:FixJ family two-component response regulator